MVEVCSLIESNVRQLAKNQGLNGGIAFPMDAL